MSTFFRSALLMALIGPLMVVICMRQSALVQAAAAPDAERGKLAFERRCTGCHALDRVKEGPPLRTVYGRKAGSVVGFPYSDELKAAAITWDEETLEKWLTDPEKVVPGTEMDFHVERAEERADIIHYLQVASGKPSR